MSDRLALLEQRVADLEAECAGLAAFSTVCNTMEIEPDESARFIEAARQRWPEVSADRIEKVTHGLLLLGYGPGLRPHE